MRGLYCIYKDYAHCQHSKTKAQLSAGVCYDTGQTQIQEHDMHIHSRVKVPVRFVPKREGNQRRPVKKKRPT